MRDARAVEVLESDGMASRPTPHSRPPHAAAELPVEDLVLGQQVVGDGLAGLRALQRRCTS